MKLGMNCNAKGAAILVAALSCSIANPAAHAASSTRSINVKMRVGAVCNLNVVNMDFGTVTQVTGTETASSYVTVICSQRSTIFLSFTPTFSVAGTTRNSTLVRAAGGTVNFSMALQGYTGTLNPGVTGFTYINGQLAATPGAAAGSYQSTETLWVNY